MTIGEKVPEKDEEYMAKEISKSDGEEGKPEEGLVEEEDY